MSENNQAIIVRVPITEIAGWNTSTTKERVVAALERNPHLTDLFAQEIAACIPIDRKQRTGKRRSLENEPRGRTFPTGGPVARV